MSDFDTLETILTKWPNDQNDPTGIKTGENILRKIFGVLFVNRNGNVVPLQQQINRKVSTRPITRNEASIVSGAGFMPKRSKIAKIRPKKRKVNINKQSINFKKER